MANNNMLTSTDLFPYFSNFSGFMSIESNGCQLPFGGRLSSCIIQSGYLGAENPLTACRFLFGALRSCKFLSVVITCFIKGVDVDLESDFLSDLEFTFWKKRCI